MTRKTLEFFFDVGSPTTYLAWTQVPRVLAATRAPVSFRPMLLGGVFKATGNASPATVPAKGLYTLQDLQRFARRYGVPFTYNPYFPINTMQLMRSVIGIQLRAPEKFKEFTNLVFTNMWVNSLNLGDPAVWAALLTRHGHDPAEVFNLTQDPAIKDALRANTDEAVSRGAFGAPTFFVGEEMFFGQDRLDFVEEALRRRPA